MKNQRKVYLINPNFQLKVTLYFIGLAVLNIALFYGCIRYFFNIFQSKGIEVGIPKDHVFFMFINDQVAQMNTVFIVSSIITVILLLIAGVLISHRIAGPMYRINKDLRQMAESKKLKSLEFREKDFFQEIPEAFNMVVDSYNEDNDEQESLKVSNG